MDPLIKSQQTGDPQGIQIFDSGGRDPPRVERIEVITSVQRRRRWSTEEEVRIVSCYLARETRRFAKDVGLVPCTTPLESPQFERHG